jgi:hypothetical protein
VSRIIVKWLYNGAASSVLIASLFHANAQRDNEPDRSRRHDRRPITGWISIGNLEEEVKARAAGINAKVQAKSDQVGILPKLRPHAVYSFHRPTWTGSGAVCCGRS